MSSPDALRGMGNLPLFPSDLPATAPRVTEDAAMTSQLPRFHGVVPPLITPLADRDQLDIPAFTRLIDHHITGGANTLFLLGTTGELASLSPRTRRDVITRGARHIAGRVPFVVGITDLSLPESLALASHAMVAGAAAVVVTVPYYLPPTQDELVTYVQTIAREQPLPILLYNIPVLTKVAFEVETVRRLADVDKVIGIKDSSGELQYLRDVAATARPDWSLLVGAARLFTASIEAGLHGCVPGPANIAPRLFADLYAALTANDAPRAAALQARVDRVSSISRITGSRVPDGIRGIKTALNLMGIGNGQMAHPFQPATPDQRDQIRAILLELDIPLAPVS
jgi:4-hydroxy-tetrahydrodipicolinate synthase